MRNTIVRLEVYKKISGESDYDATFETIPFIVDDLKSVTSVFGIEQIKDTVKFTLPLKNEARNGIMINNLYNIDIGDLIKLYAYDYPMVGSLSDHQIMVAYIKNYTFNSSQGNGTISFTCYNRSEVLLDNFIFITENTGNKVPNMLVQAVNRIKNFNQTNIIHAYKDYSGLANPGAKGAYNELGVKVTDFSGYGYIKAYKAAAYDENGNLLPALASNVPTTVDADGNSLYYFEDAVFVETYKSFIDHLDDLSTTKYTGDTNKGAYIYYVDDENNLHWHSKKFSTVSSWDNETLLSISEFEELSTSLSKDMNDIVNAIIINCGTDPSEAGMLTFGFDASSMGKNGAKWKYVAKTDIGEDMRRLELESGLWASDDGTQHTSGMNYPKYIDINNYPSSYPWTIQTSAVDQFGSFSYTGKVTTVSSGTEYRTYFRNVAKFLGKQAAEKIIDYGSEPLLKGSYTLEQGTNTYIAGDVLKIKVQSLGIQEIDNIQLRILSVTHSFQGGDWQTTLELKEDRDLNLLK